MEDTPRRRPGGRGGRGRPARSGPGERPRAADFWSQPDVPLDEGQEEGRLQGLVDRTQEADTEEDGEQVQEAGEEEEQVVEAAPLAAVPAEAVIATPQRPQFEGFAADLVRVDPVNQEGETAAVLGATVPVEEIVAGEEGEGAGEVQEEVVQLPGAAAAAGPPQGRAPPNTGRLRVPPVNRVRGVAGVEAEQVSLEDWLDPEVPGPHIGPVEEDATGWNMIDKWGVWDCTLCQFPTMADIPGGYRAIWASSMAKILQAIREADGGSALERGLKWFLILPKALFRQGRRGGEAGKGLVGQRVNCLVREDWGGLLNLLERDIEKANMEDRRGRREATYREERERWAEEKERDKKRRNALSLLSRGLISKAVRSINSYGIGDMGDHEVREQMAAKYPDRGAPLPPSVTRGQCIDSLRGLKDVLLGLEAGKSAGTGGLKPEYLTCLAEVWGEEDMSKLEEFGMRYLAGQLPPWWYRIWMTVATVPLYKTTAKTTVRPIGIRPCLSRAIHKVVTKSAKPTLTKYFEPQQVVLSQAGAAKLVLGVRMLAEANLHFAVVKSDIKNAFNNVSRGKILNVMEGAEELRHLVWHAAQTLAPSSALEHGGKRWGEVL